jgi:circadian clock protein KaiB
MVAPGRGKRGTKPDAAARLERCAASAAGDYVLQLFITGATPNSMRAVANILKICERHFKGRYRLDVVDLYQKPEMAAGEQIIAAPTLLKHEPSPTRRIVGDLSDESKVVNRLRAGSEPWGDSDA